MAFGDLIQNVKLKVRSMYDNFFYEGTEAPAPQPGMTTDAYAGEQAYQQPPQGWQQPQQQSQQAWQTQPQQGWQQPQAQQAWQTQPQQGWQGQQPQQQAWQAQPQQAQQPARNRRAHMHANQAESNVVDFGAYQQQPYQPQQQPAPAEEQPQQAQQPAQALLNARVINARSMGDCRSAITLLRKGDAVVMVMEGIADPAEMRRLVDTLSGACYCLTATITKVSRYGVYLLAPQAMPVFTDQATSQMNSAPMRPRYQPMPGVQRPSYGAAAQNAYPPQNAYQPAQPAYQETDGYQPQNNPYAPQAAYQQPQQAFSQRQAAPEEAPQAFYSRPVPQQAAAPAFAPQRAASGYMPDEATEAAAE